MGSTGGLSYWQVNVPVTERTEDCPEALRNLSAKDAGILSTPDSEYHVQSWAEVQVLAATNRLDLFQRIPSELRRYIFFTWQLKLDYGSVMNFILTQRLSWQQPVVAVGRPFELEEDISILYNDWPYGIDERIVHLVVWTKFELGEDPATGDLTDVARMEIDEYVAKTFGSRAQKDQVIWFKNWRSLKSIHAVEHFHVMMFDPDPEFIKEITNGDIPFCEKADLGLLSKSQ